VRPPRIRTTFGCFGRPSSTHPITSFHGARFGVLDQTGACRSSAVRAPPPLELFVGKLAFAGGQGDLMTHACPRSPCRKSPPLHNPVFSSAAIRDLTFSRTRRVLTLIRHPILERCVCSGDLSRSFRTAVVAWPRGGSKPFSSPLSQSLAFPADCLTYRPSHQRLIWSSMNPGPVRTLCRRPCELPTRGLTPIFRRFLFGFSAAPILMAPTPSLRWRSSTCTLNRNVGGPLLRPF